MIIVINRFLLRKGFRGIALWPFLIVREEKLKSDVVFLNHEKIHVRQQLELLVVFFYLWYAIEFLVRWVGHKNRYLAYKNICFEREAYLHEKDRNYLKQRSFWDFLKYV